MPNYTHTVHVPCQWNISEITTYILTSAQGRISVATELELQVQLAAIMVMNALSDPHLPICNAENRILYVFTLPEFFFRTIATSGFDLLDAATRAALSLAPIPPIPIGTQTDIRVPATDSRTACTNIGLQVATQLTAFAPPGSLVHKYLMDSVLFLGSAVMYAGHYSFTTGRTLRKVDNLAIVLRLSLARTGDGLPTWSVHLTWKILNSTIDTMKSETHVTPDIGYGSYAPAPNQPRRAGAMSRTLMHGAVERTDHGKVRTHNLAKDALGQLHRTYLEAQVLGPKHPSPREYLKHDVMASASPAEVARNRRMALDQLGLDSEKAKRSMEDNAGDGTWLSTPGATLPSGFLQVPDAFTITGAPIYIYTEICLDHTLQLFRFLSAFRFQVQINLMVLISGSMNLEPDAFTHLPPSMGDFIVFQNDGGGKSVHIGTVKNGILKMIDPWINVTDQTVAIQTIIQKIIPPSATAVPPLEPHSSLIVFSSILRIL